MSMVKSNPQKNKNNQDERFCYGKLRKHRKITAVIFSLIFIFSLALGTVALKPKPANAIFGVGDVSITAGDIPRTISRILDKIIVVVKEGLKQLAIVSLNNAIDTYVQNVAYETAVSLATGDVGQKSLIVKQPIGKILQNAGEMVMGDFLDSLGKDILGHSLCEPIDPRFNLKLTIFLEKSQKPRQPKCTLTDIWHKGVLASVDNMKKSGLGLSNLKLADVVQFSSYFDPRSNNLGTFMVADRELKKKIRESRELESKTRQIEGNFKSVRRTISDETKTPSETVKNTLENAERLASEKSVPAKSSAGNSIMAILARGLNTFAKTFLGEWTKTLFKKGLVEPSKKSPSDIAYNSSGQSLSGISSARNYYKELIRPNFETDITVDVTSNLSNCPADKKARRWYNCRISSNLKQAIDQRITLREAITPVSQGGYGLINPKAIFGYDRYSRKEPDYENGFPYSSLVIMRKYRIIPVTWELAALYIRDVMNTDDHDGKAEWTIKDVMDCYEQPSDLDPNNGDETLDNTLPKHCRINPDNDSDNCTDPECINPFYHLVNPDWVLKAPATQCLKEGPGPEIIHEEYIEVPRQDLSSLGKFETVKQRIISRADYCADERSCIKEDDQGNCLFYGYCVKEKPVWHFNAESCPAQFDTCRSMEPVKQAYSTFKNLNKSDKASYLSNTLRTCPIDSTGCGWYSLLYDPVSGQWEGNQDLATGSGGVGNGQADRLYANSNIQKCSVGDVGCTLLIKPSDFDSSIEDPNGNDLISTQNLIAAIAGGKSSDYNDLATIQPVYMKISPDWLDCSKANVNRSPECDKYATECAAEDLGCQFYTPVNGDPKIPAIHDSNDLCSAECQGFNQFTEVPSWFTDAQDGVIDGLPTVSPPPQFVPSTAQVCQQPGCESFTNLDEVQRGGEGRQYYTKIRQCVTPGTSGTKTYFTWEGSDTTGFQLKRWVMLEGAGGAPCTEVIPGSPTTCSNTTSCDPQVDGASCRSFFDNSGNTYNADIDLVIYSHEDCHPLRRTVDGTIYYGIPSMSQSCQAENVGCLEYKGPAANNIRVLFVDTFEPSDTTPNDLTFGWDGGILTNESLQLNGHSFKLSGAARKNVSADVVSGRWYKLSFFAKGSGTLLSWLENGIDPAIIFPSVTLTNDWQYYELGPIELTHEITDEEKVAIWSNSGGYIDNIILKESPGTSLFIKDSWNQSLATQCANEGAYGCELYRQQNGADIALKSFHRLCEEKYVGCSAFIDTQNSDSVDAQTFNTDNDSSGANSLLDNITVPADEAILLVDNQDYYCGAQAKGCQLAGLPTFDRQTDENASFTFDCASDPCVQSQVSEFNTVALINNPDQYLNVLCQEQEQFCTQYKVGDGIASFIDPGDRLCEYKENVNTGSGITSDWFKKGTTEFCVSPNGGQPYKSDDPNYDGWVAECEAKYDTCSKIVDVEDGNRPYYLIHDTLNDSIKECQEEGLVDREAGCRLFADNSSFGNKPELYSEFAYDPEISPDGQPPQSDTFGSSHGRYPFNTTNVLIKVKPDRVCEEFLHCASSLVVQDKSDNLQSNSGKEKAICLGIGLCKEIDANGKCVDGGAELLGYNDKSSEFVVDNSSAPISSLNWQNLDKASWTIGFARAGEIWPQSGVSGLFPYHEMKEIGTPLTLPNSGFEDPNNFAHRYASWPDYIWNGSVKAVDLMQNVKIVTREGGINPYEGERMLSMKITNTGNFDNDKAFVTTAALPASPELDMSLSFYANFDSLITPSQVQGTCVDGTASLIGNACAEDSECFNNTGTCGGSGLAEEKFCKRPINGIYPLCENDATCNNGFCGYWECQGGANDGDFCDPNVNECGTGSCSFVGNVATGKECTAGAESKIGTACETNRDCVATYGTCKISTTVMEVKFLNGDGSEIQTEEISIDRTKSGWRQITVPFNLPAGTDEFRIQIVVADFIGSGNLRGSVQLDNVEIETGLWVAQSKIVGSSCRLYSRSEALSCDDADKSNITGSVIKTHKGWRGYCVESVPDQQSVCMNWWPVDVVQGDANFYGAGEVVDLDYSNNLYYCLQSTGDLSSSPSGDGSCSGTINCSVMEKSECETFEAAGICTWDDYYNECYGSKDCAVYDSSVDCQAEPQNSYCTWNPNGGALPITTYTYKSPQKKICGSHELSGDISVSDEIYLSQVSAIAIIWDHKNSCNYCGCHWPQNGAKFMLEQDRDKPYEWLYESGQFGCDGGCDSYSIKAIFDQNTKRLDRFEFRGLDASPKNGGGLFHMEVYLRDVCQTIARVNTSYGAHVPWLSRFENPPQDNSSPLFYKKKAQDKEPFGSIAAPSNDYLPYEQSDLNPWLKSPLYGIEPSPTPFCAIGGLDQECARAGSAYSCWKDCGANRVCISGSPKLLGKTCKVHDDCIDEDDLSSNVKPLCAGYYGNYQGLSGTTNIPFAMDHGIKRLRELFAKSFDIYGWDYSTEKYVKCNSSDPTNMPGTCAVPADSMLGFSTTNVSWPYGPNNTTGVIIDDYDITGCGWPGFKYNGTFICSGFNAQQAGHAPEVTALSIDDYTQGDISLYSGQYVTLSFYPNVDPDRQPLKGLKIDWGDGTPLQPNQNLINFAGQGLPIQKYVFVHQYICDQNTTCTFNPRIQLRDNWNWCTADADHQDGVYDCDDSVGWVDFPGTIQVEPAQEGGGSSGGFFQYTKPPQAVE